MVTTATSDRPVTGEYVTEKSEQKKSSPLHRAVTTQCCRWRPRGCAGSGGVFLWHWTWPSDAARRTPESRFVQSTRLKRERRDRDTVAPRTGRTARSIRSIRIVRNDIYGFPTSLFFLPFVPSPAFAHPPTTNFRSPTRWVRTLRARVIIIIFFFFS